jgi:hypothetical protein
LRSLLSQIKRSERQMLEELYGYMSGLQAFEKETLMDEEPETMQRRAAIKQVGMLTLPSTL